jgi:hypothetical protein
MFEISEFTCVFGKCVVLPSYTPQLNYPLVVSTEENCVISKLDEGCRFNLKLV